MHSLLTSLSFVRNMGLIIASKNAPPPFRSLIRTKSYTMENQGVQQPTVRSPSLRTRKTNSGILLYVVCDDEEVQKPTHAPSKHCSPSSAKHLHSSCRNPSDQKTSDSITSAGAYPEDIVPDRSFLATLGNYSKYLQRPPITKTAEASTIRGHNRTLPLHQPPKTVLSSRFRSPLKSCRPLLTLASIRPRRKAPEGLF